MNSNFLNHRALVFVAAVAICLAGLWLAPRTSAQDKRFPERDGHINDFAEVLDAATRTRLEGVLSNLKEKTALDFVVATIKSTNGEDLYDYSLRIAHDWKIGEPTGPGRSVLVVIAGDNGKLFSQVTPGARLYLPEGLIGDMGRRMRDAIDRSGFSSGLVAGVRTFVDRTGELHNFDFAALDPQRGETIVAEQQRPRTVARPPIENEASPNPQPTPIATPIAEATVAPNVNVTPSPEPSQSPSESPSPVELARATPAESPAAQPSPSETPSPSATPAESTTAQPSPSETPAPATPKPTSSLFDTPPAKSSPSETSSPVATPIESPSAQPSPSETPAPVEAATPTPVAKPLTTQIASNSARPSRSPNGPANTSSADPEDEKEEVELTLTKPLDERIQLLKAFIAAHPTSVAVPRANELLVMARAMLADQKMQSVDTEGGLQLFRQAIAEAPIDMPDRLFIEVIARIPLNLFVRGQRDAALDAAQKAEALARGNSKRLLALAQFYLETENATEAARIAEAAIQLTPDSAPAHQALGAARHIALRLDDAESEYARALALDSKSAISRIALADLKRAGGKNEEALALYREQLQADQKSVAARTGMILSLLELGKREEAEAELKSALETIDKSMLPLLAGTAYWFIAHNDPQRGLELAQQAVTIEPRYSWGEIALARGLVAAKQPLQAERALRYVRQYSRFPTLDYEVASVLVGMGLYDEAMQELVRSFTFKNGEIETKLAGTVATHAPDFNELLAPERRAAIFQKDGAEPEAHAKIMKALMAFNAALDRSSPNEDELLNIAQDFIKGDDPMRTFREIYIARKLVKFGVGLSSVIEMMDQATRGVENALSVPAATVAVQAEELADVRARALAQGGLPDIPAAPRAALDGILRGRIEDLAGLAFFNMNKPAEAATRLRRAVATATEGTPLWRSAMWHLGAALEADSKDDQALLYYIKSYVNGPPDAARRSVIENVYKKVNGTLDGLDDKIGPGFAAAGSSPTPSPTPN